MRKKIIVVALIAFLLNVPQFETARRVDGATEELFASLLNTFFIVAVASVALMIFGRILVAVLTSARAAGRAVGGAPKPALDEPSRDPLTRTDNARAAY